LEPWPGIQVTVFGAGLCDIFGPTILLASFRCSGYASTLRDLSASLVVTCFALIAEFRQGGFECGWLLLRAARQR